MKRKDWFPTEHTWICSEHFVSRVKSNNPLAPNYVPTIFQHTTSPVKRKLEAKSETFKRRQVAKKSRIEESERTLADKENTRRRKSEEEIQKKINAEIEEKRKQKEIEERRKAEEAERLIREEAEEQKRLEEEAQQRLEQEKEAKRLEEIETNRKLKDIVDKLENDYKELHAKYNKAMEEIVEVKSDNSRLTSKLDTLSRRILTKQALIVDNKKVKYYTGLPSFSVLDAIYSLVTKGLPDNNFDHFLMTLMKFRLNCGDQDLAYRFGINQSTVSRAINKWIDILFTKLSNLIHWPEREELMKTMPTAFKKQFKRCAVIIDCFEIFIDRPTSLMPRAQTWSNYKKHNTCKYLIGITPQGSISFISKGWGGRVSDVHLTENCGLLSKLLPGDVILAHWGFNIEQSAGMYCAKLCIPPFMKGETQLSKLEIDTARSLSQVRIHVERVIGLVRQKYS